MDYIENYSFAQEGGSGGIPLHIYGAEYIGGSGLEKGIGETIYFPGGLFVNPVFSNYLETKTNIDPTTKNVFENYDVFLDLVSASEHRQKFNITKKMNKRNNGSKKTKT